MEKNTLEYERIEINNYNVLDGYFNRVKWRVYTDPNTVYTFGKGPSVSIPQHYKTLGLLNFITGEGERINYLEGFRSEMSGFGKFGWIRVKTAIPIPSWKRIR